MNSIVWHCTMDHVDMQLLVDDLHGRIDRCDNHDIHEVARIDAVVSKMIQLDEMNASSSLMKIAELRIEAVG